MTNYDIIESYLFLNASMLQVKLLFYRYIMSEIENNFSLYLPYYFIKIKNAII